MTKAQKRTWSDRTKKTISISLILFFFGGLLAISWVIGKPLLRELDDPEKFRAFVDAHGFWGPLAFIGLFALQVMVAFVPGEPFEIFAGYAFGVWQGILFCMLGIVLGSTIVFFFVRTFGVKVVELFFSREKINSMRFLNNKRKRNTLAFILFLIPGTPKDLLNYVVPLTDMQLSSWFVITITARLPSVITSVVGGNALGLQNYTFAIIVFAVTFALSAVGLVLYNRWSKRREQRAGSDDAQSAAPRRSDP